MSPKSRILIIEDESACRRNAQRILDREGFLVRTAADGVEGLAALLADPPDLVVCDILMPGLDGYGVLHAARVEPRTAQVPFIFVTGLADRISQRRGMTEGADDFLTKPYNPTELLEAVQARLKRTAELDSAGPGRKQALQRIEKTLTERETEVLRLLGRGLSTKEIATDLGISPRTVDIHRANLMRKLDLRSATAAARFATEAGLA